MKTYKHDKVTYYRHETVEEKTLKWSVSDWILCKLHKHIYLFIYLSIHPSIHPSICVCAYLFSVVRSVGKAKYRLVFLFVKRMVQCKVNHFVLFCMNLTCFERSLV